MLLSGMSTVLRSGWKIVRLRGRAVFVCYRDITEDLRERTDAVRNELDVQIEVVLDSGKVANAGIQSV